MVKFLRYKYLNSIKPRSFNKRTISLYKSLPKKEFCLTLLIKKQIFFELNYFKIIKIVLKHFFKAKYKIFKKVPIFFSLQANVPVSLKGKNSRMGKGTGKFSTWKFLLSANSSIFSMGIVCYFRLFFFLKFLRKRISKHLYFFYKFF